MLRQLRTWFRSVPHPDEESGTLTLRSPIAHRQDPFVEAHNDFAVAFYAYLQRQPGNLFFSPFSVRAALLMTLAGARGETEAEMRAVLRVPASDQTAHESTGKLIQRLTTAGRGAYGMAIANALWKQRGTPFEAGFLDLVTAHYGAPLHEADFARDAAEAVARINEWVESQTNRTIRDLIPPGGLATDTRLVLANAIWFKGQWQRPFLELETRDEPFYVEGGRKPLAPLMRLETDLQYMQGDGFQAVDLPYKENDLSMLLVVPDEKEGLNDLEKQLSAQWLHEIVERLLFCDVRLFLPRFETTWSADLAQVLARQGMTSAFSRERADLSRMNGLQPPDDDALFISSVFHKAFVELDERGTEAAAATAVVIDRVGSSMRRRPPPPPTPIVRADRPFLFAIRDRMTGVVLFFGRVADPSSR